MSIQICEVSGTVKNLLGSNVSNAILNVYALTPFMHTGSLILGQIASTSTDADGEFIINVIETATVGQRLTFSFLYSDGISMKRKKDFNLVVPDDPAANFSDLVTDDSSPIVQTSFPAASVTVVPSGNLTSTNVQSALQELQTDIDARVSTTLASGKIYIGNSSNVATAQTVSGDLSIDNAGTSAITSGVIVDADINASANITRSKIATGTASHVIINTAGGVLSSEATLAKSRGGTAADNSSVTFPSSGTVPSFIPTNHATVVSSATGALTMVGPNASTVFPLVSGGASADPAYALLTVPGGGTGLATLTANNVILGNGTSTPTFVAPSTSGNVLTSNGTTWTSAAAPAATAYIVGSAYIDTTGSATLTRTNTALGALTNNANCPGPTLEYTGTGGSIQTTDANNAIFTVNSLLLGKYKVTMKFRAQVGTLQSAAFAINDGTNTRGYGGWYDGTVFDGYMPIEVVAYFEYGSTSNISFQLFASATSGAVTVDFTDGRARVWFGIERIG